MKPITREDYEARLEILEATRSLLRTEFVSQQSHKGRKTLNGLNYKFLDDRLVRDIDELERLWKISRWMYSQNRKKGSKKGVQFEAPKGGPKWEPITAQDYRKYLTTSVDRGGAVVRNTGTHDKPKYEALRG